MTRGTIPHCAGSLCAAAAVVVTGCGGGPADLPSPADGEEFKSYWLIFVTEDFLPGPQVKHERGSPGPPSVSVLKLNFTREFLTDRIRLDYWNRHGADDVGLRERLGLD